MSEYDTWASVYDAWGSGMPGDVPHYVSLAREADGPIVELAVGTGRVAIEVVRETGKPVLGIDSSQAMLKLQLGDEALHGGFDREPFTDESLEFVSVTRKSL
jgi:ubiquinone/menaquinone biosynthesis C-methylase UbiE